MVKLAENIVAAHTSGLQARRAHDLISEKLLLHIDGSGDFQWADIFFDQRIEIPRLVSEFRKTENLLRPIVDNAVSHHTMMPLRYFVESQADRRARERALIDGLFANHVALQQDFLGLFSDALYLAMPAGFCPVHRYWRDDATDQYEPTPGVSTPIPTRPGILDCWVGNPFDTVFDPSAKRGSVRWASYGRWLPASLVRQAFGHVKGVATLEGGTRLSSAAQFQRIARDWRLAGLNVHGSPVVERRRDQPRGEDEMLYVLCREVLPGAEPDWPEGRLQLVAVPGTPDFRRGGGQSGGGILLADQALPAGDFSWTLFYSHFRGDDVLGKPWVENLDQLQIELNIAISKEWETVNKMLEAPIVVPGGMISEDVADFGGFNILEVEPTLGNVRPRVMEWPTEILTALRRIIEDKRRALYTIGGYQAASRGEAPGSRMAYRAILALQSADSSIHGPVNARYRRSACDFARGCWRQFKAYGDVAWLLPVIGDEYAYLADPYVDKTRLSADVPDYKLVNAFGASPEMRAQEVLELVQMRGADGQPFLSTEEARRQYPSQSLFGEHATHKSIQKRRARTVAAAVDSMVRDLREQTGLAATAINDPQVQQAAQYVFGALKDQFPIMRDDDLRAHIDVYSETTQDETADPITRLVLKVRQDWYYQWQAMQSVQGAPGLLGQSPTPQGQATAPQRQPAGPSPARPSRPGQDRRSVAQEMGRGGPGTTLQDTVEQAVRQGTRPQVAAAG